MGRKGRGRGQREEERDGKGSERNENLYVPCNIWTKFTPLKTYNQLVKAMSRNEEVAYSYCKKEITKELMLTCTCSLLG